MTYILYCKILPQVGVSMSSGGDEIACMPHCVAHQALGCSLFDQLECMTCKATSEPLITNDFVYRIYVAEFLELSASSKFFDFFLTSKILLACTAKNLLLRKKAHSFIPISIFLSLKGGYFVCLAKRNGLR